MLCLPALYDLSIVERQEQTRRLMQSSSCERQITGL